MNKDEIMEGENEEAKIQLGELETYSSLEAVTLSPGGKILTDNMMRDVMADIDELADGYKKLPHTEMIAICADMKNKLDIYKTLMGASKNKDYTKEALKATLGL